MKALDFEYDGLLLSDFGYIICTFSSADMEEYSVGSQISFNLTAVNSGRKNYLTSINYDECITAEFQICKNQERLFDTDDRYFTIEEQRELTRWLNRPTFLPLAIIDDGYETIYFEGSFNLTKIELAGGIIGFTLSLQTNRPFALNKKYSRKFSISSSGGSIVINDSSDEIGYVYPTVEITCGSSGTLSITNSIDNRVTQIENCTVNEVITMNNMMIESSLAAHQSTIMNDFNFVFLRISNTFKNRKNELTFSLPCTVTISYSPIRKVGI